MSKKCDEKLDQLYLMMKAIQESMAQIAHELQDRTTPIVGNTEKRKKAFIMPFGKHKGMSFDEIEDEDSNYLDWIEENMDNEKVQEELAKWKGV